MRLCAEGNALGTWKFDGSRAWYADYTYGETWRCWLRKPTDEERKNTPWEEC